MDTIEARLTESKSNSRRLLLLLFYCTHVPFDHNQSYPSLPQTHERRKCYANTMFDRNDPQFSRNLHKVSNNLSWSIPLSRTPVPDVASCSARFCAMKDTTTWKLWIGHSKRVWCRKLVGFEAQVWNPASRTNWYFLVRDTTALDTTLEYRLDLAKQCAGRHHYVLLLSVD